jgi:hypothetical protein
LSGANWLTRHPRLSVSVPLFLSVDNKIRENGLPRPLDITRHLLLCRCDYRKPVPVSSSRAFPFRRGAKQRSFAAQLPCSPACHGDLRTGYRCRQPAGPPFIQRRLSRRSDCRTWSEDRHRASACDRLPANCGAEAPSPLLVRIGHFVGWCFDGLERHPWSCLG